MNGIEKGVDNLGRVVIPIEFRKKLGIELKSKVLLSLEGDTITISSVCKSYALCGVKIEGEHKIRLCDNCISIVKCEY